jgi:hypothetical protein
VVEILAGLRGARGRTARATGVSGHMHTPPTHVLLGGHMLPQLPQWSCALLMFTHTPEQ